MLHASTLPPTEHCERVVDSKENSTRQRCHAPNTATRVSIPKKLLRTLHAPKNSEKAVDSKQNSQDNPRASAAMHPRQNSQDAPRASAATRPQQREGRQLQTDFLDFLRTLQALALPHADDSDAGDLENSHDASARAFRHAGSPEGCIPPTTARPCQAHPRQIRNKIEYHRGGVGSLVYVSYGGGVGAVLYVLRCRC